MNLYRQTLTLLKARREMLDLEIRKVMAIENALRNPEKSKDLLFEAHIAATDPSHVPTASQGSNLRAACEIALHNFSTENMGRTRGIETYVVCDGHIAALSPDDAARIVREQSPGTKIGVWVVSKEIFTIDDRMIGRVFKVGENLPGYHARP